MREYVLPGELISSLQDFYRVIGEAINGPGGHFGSNLDALDDCLVGDYGTPPQFRIRWSGSFMSRRAMNHDDAAIELTERLKRCHPDNRQLVAAQLAAAKAHNGPTTFDWIVEILRSHKHVELILD